MVGVDHRILMALYVSINGLAQLLSLAVEIRMVDIQEDFAFLDPSLCDGIVRRSRIEHRATIRKERDQLAVVLVAGIEDNWLLIFERPDSLCLLRFIKERKVVSFASGATVFLVVLGAIGEGAGNAIVVGLEGEEPVVALRAVVVDAQWSTDQLGFGIPTFVSEFCGKPILERCPLRRAVVVDVGLSILGTLLGD